MSEKSFHRSWISQFGLYRYDDNLRKRKRDSNICFYGITGTASIIIIVIFVFITNTDFDPPKRLIILSHENKSHLNQLSTASGFLQQIPTNYQFDEITVTTPLSTNTFSVDDSKSNPQTLELKSYHNQHLLIPNHNIYPNHRYDVRRQVEEIYQPRPFHYIMRGTPPTAFQVTNNNSSNFPHIPKEYVGSVNSIQDILRQIRDNKGNNHQESNGMHKIKIAGTYKHKKADDIISMFEPVRKNRGQNLEMDQSLQESHSVNTRHVIGDPFFKYKPNSLSDVNLMATNQFRFAPYSILSNNYVPSPSHTKTSMDPGSLYNQIIVANKNRVKYLEDNDKNDNIQGKQTPFSLMLDVYPMPDEEHFSATKTYPLLGKFRNPINSNILRHPGISSINSLQPLYHNANYHQLKGHRYPNIPHYNNDYYFRKFATKQLNSGLYRPVDGVDGNNPSQITVHLNLFPKKKDRSDNHNRNVDILNRDETVVSEKDDQKLINIRLQERMAKLSNKINLTDEDNSNSAESIKVRKISNKLDIDVFQNTTETNIKHSVIMNDDSSENVDSSEDIFNKEFLQFRTTSPITEFASDSTTAEPVSVDNTHFNSIPTILPIEPRRRYGHNLDTSLFINNKILSFSVAPGVREGD